VEVVSQYAPEGIAEKPAMATVPQSGFSVVTLRGFWIRRFLEDAGGVPMPVNSRTTRPGRRMSLPPHTWLAARGERRPR